MKKLLLVSLAALLVFSAFGQPEQKDDVEKGILKLNFLPLSLSYEFRVDKQMSVMVQPSFWLEFTDNWMVYPNIDLAAIYRYYYNFDNRNAKGKRTAKNSVNYVGAVMVFSFWDAAWSNNVDPDDFIRYFGVGPLWGIQRNYPRNFSLGINLGPMVAVGNQGIRADAFVQLTLGFWLN